MRGKQRSRSTIGREIALALLIKALLLVGIWWLWFSEPLPESRIQVLFEQSVLSPQAVTPRPTPDKDRASSPRSH